MISAMNLYHHLLVGLITLGFASPHSAQFSACETEYLRLDTPGVLAELGQSVATSDVITALGAPFEDDGQFASGAAYTFDPVTGAQIQKLSSPSPGSADNFGLSIGVSGTTVIVGEPFDDTLGFNSGRAFLYDGLTGALLHTLIGANTVAVDQFGEEVAISSSRVVVGSPRHDGKRGEVYLFLTANGGQISSFGAPNPTPGDQFGRAVALEFDMSIPANNIVIGAPFTAGGGTAYLYEAFGGTHVLTFTSPSTQNGDAFGSAVDVQGGLAIVGAPGADGLFGAVYVFDVATGAELHRLTGPGAGFNQGFGRNIAIHGSTVLVGVGGQGPTGTTHVFDAISGVHRFSFIGSQAMASDRFGAAVDLSDSVMVVGAPGDDSLTTPGGLNNGSGYIYDARDLSSPLKGCASTISEATGGTFTMFINMGVENAGSFFWILGSATGTSPAINLAPGVNLPLIYDPYLELTASRPFLGAFAGFLATATPDGLSTAALILPSGTGLAGVTLYHAYLTAETLGIPDSASNAVTMTIVP